jgi:hypothetical protein
MDGAEAGVSPEGRENLPGEIGGGGPGSLFCRNYAPACPLNCRGPRIRLSIRIKSCLCIRENEQERKQRVTQSLLIRCEIQSFLRQESKRIYKMRGVQR